MSPTSNTPGDGPDEGFPRDDLARIEEAFGAASPLSKGPAASSLPRQNLEHDRYDERLWRELSEASGSLRDLAGDEEAPETFPALLNDLFLSYFKAQPNLLPEGSVEPRHRRANRPFLERTLEDPDTYRARATTSLDVAASGLAALAAGERLLEEIKNRPSLGDFFDEAARQPEAEPDADDEAPTPEEGEPDDAPDERPPELPGRDARRAVRAAAGAGKDEADRIAGALSRWGLEPADLKRVPLGERLEILRALSAPEMRRLIELVGRMRNLARKEARDKVRERRDELHSIELSGDLARLLPTELAALASPEPERRLEAEARLIEGRSLSWELKTREKEKKGPVVAMIDSCLTGETKVLGPQGAKRMDEIQAGDLVYSYDDGRLETRRVSKAWFTRRQEVFRVRTSNRSLLASANHPFLRLRRTPRVRDRGSSGRYLPDQWSAEWARVDQLRRGDRVVIMRHAIDAGAPQTLIDGTPLTEEVAWLLGLIVGDGWVSPSGVAICVYGETREKAARICKAVWGANNSRHPTYGIRIHSARLRDALQGVDELCRPAHHKRVPRLVSMAPDDIKRAFLDGYAAADGHEAPGGRTYGSTSQDLISEARMMHLALGDPVSNLTLTANQSPARIRGKLVTNRRPFWRFHVARRRSRGLDDGRVPAGLQRFATGPFAYQQILSIESAGEQETYDIEVEGSRNFVAEGMVVHNSASMSGEKMEWATAVALGLVDLAAGRGGLPKRAAALVYFNARVVCEISFAPGERDARKLLAAATVGASGGTDYGPPIERALEICGEAGGAYAGADLLLVTDELCSLREDFVARLLEEKARRRMKLYSVLIGHRSSGELERYSDRVYSLYDLAGACSLDVAGEVFGSL